MKGVISKIVPDDEMPFLANGKRVDLILNALGVVNRLNSGQLYEQSINFICDCIIERMKTIANIEEKEILVFDIVNRFNKNEHAKLRKYYDALSKSGKDKFFKDIEEYGTYIHVPPLWEKEESLFDKLSKIYRDYDWIKPVDVFIHKFGRDIKIMKPMIIGELYFIKLKQNSKKNFSARSAGALSRKGLPSKSFKNKAHQDLHSSTPIRLGRDETFNSLIGVEPEDIALMHMYYRSSALGRQMLGKRLMSTIKELKRIKRSNKVKNRNAEILNVYMKALGLRIDFLDDKEEINIYTGEIKDYETSRRMFIGTLDEYEDVELYDKIVDHYENDACFVGTHEEYDELLKTDFENEKNRQRYEIFIEI